MEVDMCVCVSSLEVLDFPSQDGVARRVQGE
jgi:hypothetical protein